MMKPRPPGDDVSMPALLRHARLAYGTSMRTALDAAGFDGIPKNGLYVIGGLANTAVAHPLDQLLEELRLSKQAAAQLVDTLITRDYLRRNGDDLDERGSMGLTERGRAAAKIMSAAGAKVDDELLSRVGLQDVERTRRTLFFLIDIGRKMAARERK